MAWTAPGGFGVTGKDRRSAVLVSIDYIPTFSIYSTEISMAGHC